MDVDDVPEQDRDALHSAESDAGLIDPTDPYAPLHAHIISVKGLYCEDGCGLVETSGYGDDRDAAEELTKSGWAVRPHSMGGLASLCKDCAARHDAEARPVADPRSSRQATDGAHTRVLPPGTGDAHDVQR